MFEIKYFRIQDHATIKASFTVAFQKLELNDCKLVQGKDGLFFSPPSRKYEKDGQTKYVNFFWISNETLRKAIESSALEQMAKEQAKTQQAASGGASGGYPGQNIPLGGEPEIPFAMPQIYREVVR